MARPKKVAPPDTAECGICGEVVEPTEEAMMFHVAMTHPLELLKHPKVAPKVANLFFDAGRLLAEIVRPK